MNAFRATLGTFVLAGVLACAAAAQSQTIPLWPGVAPGSESWTQKEQTIDNTPLGTVIINVVTPTLTAYLPDPAGATGTGVIVAPGGSCIALAWSLEGTSVAQWLAQHGIAAFVLKYRVPEKKGEGIPKDIDMDAVCKYGIADGIAAIAVLRKHAAQWHIQPNRIGIVGFSAGGMVASGTILAPDAAARPNFAAFIYGAPFGKMPAIPPNLPPTFMAWAKDDPLAPEYFVKFQAALVAAGDKPDTHIYATGGHGFGLKHHGMPSDAWIDDFYTWLTGLGFTKPA